MLLKVFWVGAVSTELDIFLCYTFCCELGCQTNMRLCWDEQLSDGGGNDHRYLDEINGSNIKLLLLKTPLLFSFLFFYSFSQWLLNGT